MRPAYTVRKQNGCWLPPLSRGLRLPQTVIIQEIISALSSQSYISNKILYCKPPAFAILNLIIQAPGFIVEVESFRVNVLDYIKELSVIAAQHKGMEEKHPELYNLLLKIFNHPPDN